MCVQLVMNVNERSSAISMRDIYYVKLRNTKMIRRKEILGKRKCIKCKVKMRKYDYNNEV